MKKPRRSPAPKQTRLPEALKDGIESLSGMDVSKVRVHRNSAKPAQLNGLAYAKASEIHVASGQERHLPHEAWHVVQQTRGRVKPTKQLKDVAIINDDTDLEREADSLGAKAAKSAPQTTDATQPDPNDRNA